MPTDLIGKLYFHGYIMFLFVSYILYSQHIDYKNQEQFYDLVIIFIIIVYVSSTL